MEKIKTEEKKTAPQIEELAEELKEYVITLFIYMI